MNPAHERRVEEGLGGRHDWLGRERRQGAGVPVSPRGIRLGVCAAAFVLSGSISPVAPSNQLNGAENERSRPTAGPFSADGGPHCFARVWLISGEVSSMQGGANRVLKVGDSIYVGDSIRASTRGEAVFITADAGIVAIRPSAEFVAESFAAEARSTDHLSLRINRGALRLVSGWIGGLNREGVQIFTPEARIGIRGTDHEPYVLPEDLADATPFETGSYDKVNRGRTLLATAAGELELRAGEVGFAPPPDNTAPSPQQNPPAQRGLLTLLLPTVLERVPDFYTAGQFEQDIDSYSQQADAIAHSRMEDRLSGKKALDPHFCPPLSQAETEYPAAARTWIARFDAGILAHDAQGIVDLFDPDAIIEATVLETGGGIATSHFDRAEFAQSVGRVTASLQDYHQVRQTLDTHAEFSNDSDVPGVRIKSRVIEQGRLQDRDFRAESDEDYLLESRSGRWLAVRALTIQR